VREREGILCPGVLHVSHQISRGVCGSLGMDTDAVMDYDCGFTATDEILRVYIKQVHNTRETLRLIFKKHTETKSRSYHGISRNGYQLELYNYYY